MRLIHIVGRKNHGKTTLLLEILQELQARGLRVGTIKHTRHEHELDTPGKDSWRLREAGAAPSAIVSGLMAAVHFPLPLRDDFYAELEPFFADCDLVLVEGHLDGPGLKIEVWREEIGGACLADDTQAGIVAVIGHGPVPTGLPRLDRRDVPAICGFLLRAVQEPFALAVHAS